MSPKFHLAFPVNNLELTREFYTKILGCTLGRESGEWIDFNFYGHQVVAHLSPEDCKIPKTNPVDGDDVPARHFGVILSGDQWEELCEKIKNYGVGFLIEPRKRFRNNPGEHRTFFIHDPSENVLEFKSFKNDSDIFIK